MFKEKILYTNDNSEWMELLNKHTCKDPCYLPKYLSIYEGLDNKDSFVNFGGKGVLYVYGDFTNYIIYPFFKRSISFLPFADDNLKKMYDIVSPYGYGGPLAQIVDQTSTEELWSQFFQTFDVFCKENNIISEFCRLHPIFENHVPVSKFSNGITQKLGQIVYIDLINSEDTIRENMIHGHYRKVRNAIKNPDLNFEFINQDYQPKVFFELYSKTMQRVGAQNKYLFSLKFFQDVFQSLAEFVRLYRVRYRGKICAEWIVFIYGDQAYAWLLGSDHDYLRFYTNILLVYDSCLQLKAEGLKFLNLGGGSGVKDDSVFQFKSGFTKLRKDYYVYKKIHLKHEYDRLVELVECKMPDSGDFFPKYRATGEIT
jgi:hypothetical protein